MSVTDRVSGNYRSQLPLPALLKHPATGVGAMSDFLLGILVALLPSMLTVAWLVWRAVPKSQNSVH
jgi:hypothetical protein